MAALIEGYRQARDGEHQEQEIAILQKLRDVADKVPVHSRQRARPKRIGRPSVVRRKEEKRRAEHQNQRECQKCSHDRTNATAMSQAATASEKD